MEASKCGQVGVGFSGGRDSSAVLAVATAVARREGLPVPVPLTLWWDDPATHEAEWQELVVRHLGLTDWLRVKADTDAGVLGAAAQDCLSALGLLWPPNLYTKVPLFRSFDGVVLTGLDGDGLFGSWEGHRVADLAARRRRPVLRDARRVAALAAPSAVRARVYVRRVEPPGWLTAGAAAAYAREVAHERASAPLSWSRWVQWFRRRRFLRLLLDGMDLVAARFGSRVVHPFLDHAFTGSLAAHGGRLGYGGRTEIMTALFGNLLPSPVLQRTSKAIFTNALWGAAPREFAETWSGKGIDESIVDPERLRLAWISERPDARSASALQSAWLYDRSHA